MAKKINNYLYLIGGSLALVLGTVGMVIPILPTTPFLLLSAFCFLRSSPRLHRWIMRHRFFGPYIYCYSSFRAIDRKVKIHTIALLWATLGISIIFVDIWQVRLGLALIGALVSIHVGSLKNLSGEELEQYHSYISNLEKKG